MRFPSSGWLPLLLISGCGVAGFAIGKSRIIGGQPRHLEETTIHPPGRRPERQSGIAPDAWRGFETLLSGRGNGNDIWKSVSRLSMEEIPDALWRLREMQSVTASRSAEAKRLAEIESALYFHWAESDPVAALADVSAMPDDPDMAAKTRRRSLVTSVLAAWARVDPDAAYRAVKDHEDFYFCGRNMLVATWTAENAFEKLKDHPDKAKDLLGWYCVAAAKNDEQRNAMLVALKERPDMKHRDWGYFMLFRDWAYRDFPAAMAEAQNHEHSGLTEHVLNDGLSQQPAAAMRWAVSHGIPPDGTQWRTGYSYWLRFDTSGAQKWLEEQAPIWQNSGHFAAVADFRVEQLSRSKKIDMKAVQPVWTALMTEWKSKDPEAAEKWLNGQTAHSQGISGILEWEGAADHE